MVVRCIANLVNSQAHNIRSGWKNVFSVFFVAANAQEPALVNMSFMTVSKVIGDHFDAHFPQVVESYQDAVKCLSEFACNSEYPDISMEAIRLIRALARYAAEQEHVFRDHVVFQDNFSASLEDKNFSVDDRVWVCGWFPVILELTHVVRRCKLDVRTRALTVLFEVLKSYGTRFRKNWWPEVFSLVIRFFDKMMPEHLHERAEWMMTTCPHALFSIVDIMTVYYDEVGEMLMPDVYKKFNDCVKLNNEQLARAAVNCFETLITSNGSKFNSKMWDSTVKAL